MGSYRRPELILQDAIADVRILIECDTLREEEIGMCTMQQMVARLCMFGAPEILARMLAAVGGPSSVAEAALVVGWQQRSLQ